MISTHIKILRLVFIWNTTVLNPSIAISFKQDVVRTTKIASDRVNTILAIFHITCSTDQAIKEVIFITVFTFPKEIILSY